MPELSQVVRQRLASRGAAGDHPDADTLTAYTEQLLSPGERVRVVEHIAVCSSCRDVIALSQPDMVEPGMAVVTPKRGWRWRPAFGMAASLAALAVITTVIIELPRKPASFDSRQPAAPANQLQADKSSAAPATQPEQLTATATGAPDSNAAGPRASSSPGSGVSDASSNKASSTNNVATARSAAVPLSPAVSVAAASPVVSASSAGVAEAKPGQHDYVNKQMFDASQTGSDAVPTVAELPAAPLPRTLAQSQFPPPLSSNAPLSFADLPPQTANGKVVRSRQLSNPPGYHFGMALIPNLPSLGRKAERGVETMAKRSLAIQPGALTHSAMESNALAPSRDDQVDGQNEADGKGRAGGDLDQSSAFSQRALAGGAANYETRSATWKVSGGNLLKSIDSTTWNAGYGPADIEFTVVTVHGANVWGGGTNAALVHSVNGGASWERIALGASASGSITGIEIAGANVHVKSSSGQEWSSQDNGKTWSLDK